MKKGDIVKIMKAGIALNRYEGLTAHVLLHGNTGCLCVIIEEDEREIYENKAFTTNREEIREIRKDMKTMLREAGRRCRHDRKIL